LIDPVIDLIRTNSVLAHVMKFKLNAIVAQPGAGLFDAVAVFDAE
jgi:hypothetical protein